MRIVRKISEDDLKSLEDRFYTYRSGKKEGKHVGWRAALDESPFILKWFESQTNKADALRYLIEENILANGGIIDLAEVLPRVRNFEDKFKKKMSRTKKVIAVKEPIGIVDEIFEDDIQTIDEVEEYKAFHEDLVAQTNTLEAPVVHIEKSVPMENISKTEVKKEKLDDTPLVDIIPVQQPLKPAEIIGEEEKVEEEKPKKRSTMDKFKKYQ